MSNSRYVGSHYARKVQKHDFMTTWKTTYFQCSADLKWWQWQVCCYNHSPAFQVMQAMPLSSFVAHCDFLFLVRCQHCVDLSLSWAYTQFPMQLFQLIWALNQTKQVNNEQNIFLPLGTTEYPNSIFIYLCTPHLIKEWVWDFSSPPATKGTALSNLL